MAKQQAYKIPQPVEPEPAFNKPFGISYSKLGTFRRCLQQYHWKYINKLFTPPSMGQARGTAGHAAIAVWHTTYNAQEATDAAWEKWALDGYQDNEEWQLLNSSLDRYYVWSKDHDTFKMISAEQKFEIEYDINGLPVLFSGYIDGIVEEDGYTWILENKFYKRMDNADMSMDPQSSLYLLAASLIDIPAKGVIYNRVRVADTKVAVTEPVVRSRLYRNSEGLGRIQEELLAQTRQMMIYEGGDQIPYRNPTKDCSWDCAFHQACLSMTDDGQEPIKILQQITNTRSND